MTIRSYHPLRSSSSGANSMRCTFISIISTISAPFGLIMRDSASRHSRIGRASTIAWRTDRDRIIIMTSSRMRHRHSDDRIVTVSSSSHRRRIVVAVSPTSSSRRRRRRRDVGGDSGASLVIAVSSAVTSSLDRHCRGVVTVKPCAHMGADTHTHDEHCT